MTAVICEVTDTLGGVAKVYVENLHGASLYKI